MPNHFHFLIRILCRDEVNQGLLNSDGDISDLISRAFRNSFISYAKSINKRYKRTGSLFQYKFKRREVTNEDYLAKLIQYIHYNPVKAGLCDKYSDWEFSSYNATLSSKPTRINREEILSLFGDENGFKQYHEDKRFDYEDLKECF